MSLVVDEVVKRYRETTAVDHVSFKVPEGSIFGLLGANGAGKTTTVRMILSILEPDEGWISWKGEKIGKLARAMFGYLPEERGLYPSMKVAEQLCFFARLRGIDRNTARRETKVWLERFQIEEYHDRQLDQLSKGNQQKVQLISTLLHRPVLLLLDEPFSGLDPVNAELLREVLLELNARGTTLVLSTHNMEQVEELCQHIALLHRSRLVFSGSLEQIKSLHPEQRRLRMEFDGDTERLAEELAGLAVTSEDGRFIELAGANGAQPEEVLQRAMRHGRVRQFQVAEPTLRQIFISEVSGGAE